MFSSETPAPQSIDITDVYNNGHFLEDDVIEELALVYGFYIIIIIHIIFLIL